MQGKLSKKELGVGTTEQQRAKIAEAMKKIRAQNRRTPLSAEELEALRFGLRDARTSQERTMDKIVDRLMQQLELD